MTERPQEIFPDVGEQHLEKLVNPSEIDIIPEDEIEQVLSSASLLGAVIDLGVQVKSTEEYTIELTLPSSDQASATQTTSRLRGTIGDETPEYTAKLYIQSLPAPSPLAISILGQYSTSVFTSDSENPNQAILGIDIFAPRFKFSGTMRNKIISGIVLDSRVDLGIDVLLVKTLSALYKEGNIRQTTVSKSVFVDDPIFEVCKRVSKRIRRLSRLKEIGAPQTILDELERHAREIIVKLSNEVNASFEGEEITELVGNIPKISYEQVLSHILEKTELSERLAEILQAIKEDTSPHKRHGFTSRFAQSGGSLRLADTKNFGRTTHLVPKWNDEARKLEEGEEGHDLLFWLGEVCDQLDRDFENYAAIVSGKIQFSERLQDLLDDRLDLN